MATTIRRCLFCMKPYEAKSNWQKFCNNQGICRDRYHNAQYKNFKKIMDQGGTCPHCKLPIVFEGLHGTGD